jgi:hypothetical protein
MNWREGVCWSLWLVEGKLIYRRPNLEDEGSSYINSNLGFGLLPGRSDGSATASKAVNVLLFLLCWFEDLERIVSKTING